MIRLKTSPTVFNNRKTLVLFAGFAMACGIGLAMGTTAQADFPDDCGGASNTDPEADHGCSLKQSPFNGNWYYDFGDCEEWSYANFWCRCTGGTQYGDHCYPD